MWCGEGGLIREKNAIIGKDFHSPSYYRQYRHRYEGRHGHEGEGQSHWNEKGDMGGKERREESRRRRRRPPSARTSDVRNDGRSREERQHSGMELRRDGVRDTRQTFIRSSNSIIHAATRDRIQRREKERAREVDEECRKRRRREDLGERRQREEDRRDGGGGRRRLSKDERRHRSTREKADGINGMQVREDREYGNERKRQLEAEMKGEHEIGRRERNRSDESNAMKREIRRRCNSRSRSNADEGNFPFAFRQQTRTRHEEEAGKRRRRRGIGSRDEEKELSTHRLREDGGSDERAKKQLYSSKSVEKRGGRRRNTCRYDKERTALEGGTSPQVREEEEEKDDVSALFPPSSSSSSSTSASVSSCLAASRIITSPHLLAQVLKTHNMQNKQMDDLQFRNAQTSLNKLANTTPKVCR